MMHVCCRCRELGKVVTGKLVVVTPDRQETFLVRGKQPAYTPPQASTMPSGAYLTATTASSRAKGNERQGTLKTAAAGPGLANSTGRDEARQQQQQGGKRNYLQQNIRAAGSTAGGSSPKAPVTAVSKGRPQ